MSFPSDPTNLTNRRIASRRSFNRSLFAAAVATPMAAIGAGLALAASNQDAPAPGTTQSKRPIDAMTVFLNGFHFYADDMGRQVEANHFCAHVSEDLIQCVIYNSNRSDAKLIGIEYIVSERVFKSLPEEEKRLWHSHAYEVKSGELIAPGASKIADHASMRALATTYGKTWHTWQIDRFPDFPTGIPQLMMGFTKDGQVDRQMVQSRDQRFGTNSPALGRERADIPWPNTDPGANDWRSGTTVQLVLHDLPVKNLRQ